MNKMIIKKLIVQGVNYKRSIHFNEGLTIISGEKTSGKSLVLSLIDYSLGKSKKIDLKVQKELGIHCDNVFLELKINESIFTFNRSLKTKTSNINIYFCDFSDIDGYTPKILALDEATKFLMNHLNINEYKLIKHKKHSNQKELSIVSFRDLFRYVYIDQHSLGTHDFLDNKSTFKKFKNPHAFKLMFNLVDKDTVSLKEELVETQNGISDSQKIISGLSEYLKDKNAEDFNELASKFNNLEKTIVEKKQAKENIVKGSKSNKDNENEMYIRLKKDLEELTNQIYEYRNQKRKLQFSIDSRNLLIREYETEIIELDATLEINYKLEIPEQNIECPLCNSIISNDSHEELHEIHTPEKILFKVKKDLDLKIKLVSSLISKDKQQLEEIDTKILRLIRKENILKSAISEFAKETEVPFLSELNSINDLVNQMTKKLEIVKESMRIHRKIEEKKKDIIVLESKVESLEKELKKLQVSTETKQNIFDFLNTEYKKYMERLKYPTNEETFIHTEQYIPYYDGSNVYSHESGGLLECMQLSYLAAILKSKDMGYAKGHPGFLLLDTLSKYVGTLKQETGNTDTPVELEQQMKLLKTEDEDFIKDPEVYEEFYKILIELSAHHQIILVENTPPEIFSQYIKYKFFRGPKGLINLKMNEFIEEI